MQCSYYQSGSAGSNADCGVKLAQNISTRQGRYIALSWLATHPAQATEDTRDRADFPDRFEQDRCCMEFFRMRTASCRRAEEQSVPVAVRCMLRSTIPEALSQPLHTNSVTPSEHAPATLFPSRAPDALLGSGARKGKEEGMDGDRSWRGLAEMRGDGGPVRPNLGTATANCHPSPPLQLRPVYRSPHKSPSA